MSHEQGECTPETLAQGQESTDLMARDLANVGDAASSGNGGICARYEQVSQEGIATSQHACQKSTDCYLAKLIKNTGAIARPAE